jgi:hypothetical protein
MRPGGFVSGVMVGVVAVGIAATGCTRTISPPAGTTASSSASSSSSTTSASPTPTVATPTGAPVGTATMKVTGGGGAVTIRYRINGAPEQTEANVSLPWEKSYSVYDQLESQVTADGGDAALSCTIVMNGDKVVALQSGPRPTCNFAYWG